MELKILPVNDTQWIKFIQADVSATIFHHPSWVELITSCYGFRPFIAAVVSKRGEILSGIPVAEVNDHLTPRRWVSLPFSDYCFPLFQDEESRSFLINELVKKYKERQCPRIEIRASLPPEEGFQAGSSFVLHTVSLDPDSTHMAKRVHRTQMQNVRTAEKNGVSVVRGSGIEEVRIFYQLHLLNRRKHGIPVQPWKYFRLLTQNILSKGLGFVLLAYKDDACVSGGIFLHWQKTLTYKYSATDELNQKFRPNHLVTWSSMQWACDQGMETFDFGRADVDDEGLREYKRRWGAQEDPLTYSYIPKILKVKGKGKVEGVFKNLIQRSPTWMCRAAGEMLYHYFG